jgi:flagellar hook-length control protein FliK
MLFNPVFINSTQSNQGSVKQNNFLGTSYLFSDIIKIYSTENNTNPLKEYSNFPEGKNIFSVKGLFELKNPESLLEIFYSKYNSEAANNSESENKSEYNPEEVLKLTEVDLRNILYSLNYYPRPETEVKYAENEKTADTITYTSKEVAVISKVKEIFELLDGQNIVSLYVKDGNNNYKLDIIPEQTELSQDINNNKLAFSNNDLENFSENEIELLSGNNDVNYNLKFGGGKQILTNDKNYEIKLTPLQNQNEDTEFIYFDNNIENDSEKTEAETNLNKNYKEFTTKQTTENSRETEKDVLALHLKKFGGDHFVKEGGSEIKSEKAPVIENNLKTARTQNIESTKTDTSYKNEITANNENLEQLNKIVKKYSNKDFEVKLDKSANETSTNTEINTSKHTESQKDTRSLNFELEKNIKESIVKGSIKDINVKPETKNSETKQPETGNKNNLVQETASRKSQLNSFEPAKNIKEFKIAEEFENQSIKQNSNTPVKETKEEEYSSQVKVKDNTGSNSNEKLTTKIDSQSKTGINNSEADKNFSQKEHSETFRSTRNEIKEENNNSLIKTESKPEKNAVNDNKTKLNEEIKSVKETGSNLSQEGVLKSEPSHITSENLRSFSKEAGSFNTNRLTETIKNIPVSEIANEISSLIQKGEKKSLTLQLEPDTLGKVKVTLDMFNKQVTARIEVDNEAAKQAVQNNLGHLKEAIHNQGIQLNSVFVSLSNEEQKQQRTPEVRKRSNNLSSEKKVEEQIEPKTLKKLGYNTYEYLA